MTARLTKAYLYILLAFDLLAFAATLLLHINAILGDDELYAQHNVIWACWVFMAFGAAIALAKERNVWKNEFKSSPSWLRTPVAAFCVYGFAIGILFVAHLSDGRPAASEAIAVPALMLAFGAMSICIVYSVLWSGSIDESEISKRSRNSLIALIAVALFFLASSTEDARLGS